MFFVLFSKCELHDLLFFSLLFPFFFLFFCYSWPWLPPGHHWAVSQSHAHAQTDGSQECFLLDIGDAGGLLLLLQQFQSGKRKKCFIVSILASVLKGQADKRIVFGAGRGGWWIKILLRALAVAVEWGFADHFTPPKLPCMVSSGVWLTGMLGPSQNWRCL